MKVIRHPVAAVRCGAVDGQLHEGQRDHADPSAPRERSSRGRHHQQHADRDGRRHGRQHAHRAGEGQHAAPAAEAGEHRPGVADHRGTGAEVAQSASRPDSVTPTAAAIAPFAMSPTNTGIAARRPMVSLAFQYPGLRSPVVRRSVTPCRRATSPASRDRAEQVPGQHDDGRDARLTCWQACRASRRSTCCVRRTPSVRWLALGLDRRRLGRCPGLRFWRLLGTGAGTSTGPGVDLRRTAMFAVWDDEAALEALLIRTAPRLVAADESWHVRLRAVGGHGSWRGVDVLGGSCTVDRRRRVDRRTGGRHHPSRRARSRRGVRSVRPVEWSATSCRAPTGCSPWWASARRRSGGSARSACGETSTRCTRSPAAASPPRRRAPHPRRALVRRGAVRPVRALRLVGSVGRARPAAPTTTGSNMP